MPIGEARPWCSIDNQCVLEDGHPGDACEVVPGARAHSRKMEDEAEAAGVHRTARDANGRAMLHKEDTRPVAAVQVHRGKVVR